MTELNETKKRYDEYLEKIDAINKKYSATYSEPTLDAPSSLDLKAREYAMPSDEELKKRAATALTADKQAAVSKIGTEVSEKIKKQESLKSKAFNDAARALLEIDGNEKVKKQNVSDNALSRNLARSSIASEGIEEVGREAEAARAKTEETTAQTLETIKKEIDTIKSDASQRLSDTEKNFLAKIEAETEKLREKALVEQRQADAYNNTLAEKEAAYRKSLGDKLNELQNREWERLARLVELKNQYGENGLENMRNEEVLQTTKDFYDSLPPADALSLFLADTSMQSVLGGGYEYFLDYLKKRR